MNAEIIIAGVGGQGILSIAAVLGSAALDNNLFIKQAEIHGMSQRGGEVQSFVRISDKPIYSDLIPKGKADLILSVEPMEALRYLPYLKKGGYVVTNSAPFINIPNYPDERELEAAIKALPNHILIDADRIAKEEIGSVRAFNFVMLGAASPFIDIPFEHLEEGINKIFARKGKDVVEMNIKALHFGRKFTEIYQS